MDQHLVTTPYFLPKLIDKTRSVEDKVVSAFTVHRDKILALLWKDELLSDNSKTGSSINFPITKTCCPTAICSRVCYAQRPGAPITWTNSLKKQLRVYQYFKACPTEALAQKVIREYNKKHLTWLRWCGSGDLFQEVVAVINRVAELSELRVSQGQVPVIQLVVTRIPEMANQIKEHPHLFLMFSLDSSSLDRKDKLVPNHTRRYFSFLRTSPTDVIPNGTGVIFDEQRTKLSMPHSSKCCPVDSGTLALKDGCNKCRRCFNNRILTAEGLK